MGERERRDGSSGWPYEDHALEDPPRSGPTWACPDGSCECHPVQEGEPRELTLLLTDDHARSIPGARCRVLYQGRVLNPDQPNADAEGWLSVAVTHPVHLVTLEWAPPDTPVVPRYPFRMHHYVDLGEDDDRAAARRRLHNLGFSEHALLSENIKEFQRAFGYAPITGNLEDIRSDLLLFHDKGWIPPIENRPASDEESGDEDEMDQAGAVPFLAFPDGKTKAKPKPSKKTPSKAPPVPRTPPPKRHKPAGGPLGTGTGTARPPAKGKLRVQVCCLFATLQENSDEIKTRCRWDKEDQNPHPVEGASFELFDMQSNVVEGFLAANGSGKTLTVETDKDGKRSLKISNLPDGQYTLRLNPPRGHELRGPMPGPITDDAIRELQLRSVGPADNFPNDPPGHMRFRLLEIAITLRQGVLVAAKIVKNLRRPGDIAYHGAVVDVKPSFLKIDWKPDWVQCRFTKGVKKNQPDPRDPAKDLSKVQFIVLHHTDGSTPGSAINEFLDVNNKHKTGAHYMVDIDGHTVKLADETIHVNHTGPCFWYGLESSPLSVTTGRLDWNNISVGIEQVHKSGEYPDHQVLATKNLIERIRSVYKTSPHNVVGHGEIALHPPPSLKRLGRKLLCPGEEYNWYILENAGDATKPASSVVPHARYADFFVNNADADLNNLSPSKVSPEIVGLQTTLSELGYFVIVTGKYDEPTIRAIEAFQVRFFSGRFRHVHAPRIIRNKVRLANLVTIQMMHDVLAARGGFRF
jgi:N-acetyl-anhydromuramyl-L-alanine amidase AmpD